MSLAKEKKAEVVGKFGRDSNDTGSTEVQVALLTERINDLTEHLREQARMTEADRTIVARGQAFDRSEAGPEAARYINVA